MKIYVSFLSVALLLGFSGCRIPGEDSLQDNRLAYFTSDCWFKGRDVEILSKEEALKCIDEFIKPILLEEYPEDDNKGELADLVRRMQVGVSMEVAFIAKFTDEYDEEIKVFVRMYEDDLNTFRIDYFGGLRPDGCHDRTLDSRINESALMNWLWRNENSWRAK